MEEHYIWIGSALAGWILLEGIKFLHGWRNQSQFDQKVKDRFMELYEMHKVKDENGRPIWYLPKEVESKQTLTLDKIQEINYSLLQLQKGQERVAAIQEEVARIQRETVVLLNVIKDQLMS